MLVSQVPKNIYMILWAETEMCLSKQIWYFLSKNHFSIIKRKFMNRFQCYVSWQDMCYIVETLHGEKAKLVKLHLTQRKLCWDHNLSKPIIWSLNFIFYKQKNIFVLFLFLVGWAVYWAIAKLLVQGIMPSYTNAILELFSWL